MDACMVGVDGRGGDLCSRSCDAIGSRREVGRQGPEGCQDAVVIGCEGIGKGHDR